MAKTQKKPGTVPARGPTGKTGKTGKTGAAGAQGPIGPAGPKMPRADVLAVVEDQFYEIRKRLDVQLGRIAELQVQVDAQRKDTAGLREQVDLVHGLLKQLIARDA